MANEADETNKGATTGLELVCRRCEYKWLYHGNSDWYTSCPRCKGTVSVRNRKRELGLGCDGE
jgi:hypothetical protein